MSHVVSLSNEVWQLVQRQSALTGTPPEQVVEKVLQERLSPAPRPIRRRKEEMTEEEQDEARRRFRSHFGAISMGTGCDNEQIDADLAREYGDNHEPK